MTAYQVMPGLTAEEYDALRADIREHGIRVPIDVDENGQVLDGHHRSIIAAELGVECPRRVLSGLTEPEKVAHALAVNVHRRNLTREQRRELLAASIKADPSASDRQHAERTGTSPTTAGAVRRDLEDAGDVSKLDTRTDAAGRQQPASRPQPQRPASHACAICDELFTSPVRHCGGCGGHYQPGVACPSCEATVNTSTGEIGDASPTTEPSPAKPRYEPEPPTASPEAKARRDRLVSNQAWSNNLAANVNWFARLAPAAYRAHEFRDQFIPEYAAAHGGVTRDLLLDAARFITALADVWGDDLKETA